MIIFDDIFEKGTNKNLFFYNNWHNGDIHYSREFVKDIMSKTEFKNYYYIHNNKKGILKDIERLEEISSDGLLDKDKSYFFKDENVYINTWIGQCGMKYLKNGLNINANYEMYQNIYHFLNISLNDILEYIPKINFNYIEKENIDNFFKNKKNNVLICNGDFFSKQSTEQRFEPLILELKDKYKDFNFILTDNSIKMESDNIFYSNDIMGIDIKVNTDLLEISYLSTYCDIIIGKESGPFVFSSIHENLMNKNKIFINFSNEKSWIFYPTGNCEYIWSNDYESSSMYNIIENSLKKKNIYMQNNLHNMYDFNIYLEIDEKIHITSKHELNNLYLEIITENEIIYYENFYTKPGLVYWFEPNNKSYLRKDTFCIIKQYNNIIYKKKLDNFYKIIRDDNRKIIVQLGSNEGNDSLSNMVRPNDFLLLVEPFEKFNKDLIKCYENIEDKHIENILITDNDEISEAIIYKHKNMTNSLAESSIIKSHVLKHFPDESGLIENKMKCISINRLFEKYNLENIDILFIDIEGLDDVVVKSIDFDKYNIHKIFYEDKHIDKDKIEKFLIEKGYNITNKVLYCEITTMAEKINYEKKYKNYVQIGSNIGDDSFQRILENLSESSRVILIEPNSNLIPQLENNYSNLKNKHIIEIYQTGISTDNETKDLYLYDDSGHSSIINRRTHPNKSSMQIECINFNDFCDKNSIKDIEILCIDTEGMDYEILYSIDLSKINIKEIYFEKWVHDNDDLNNKYRTGPNFLETHIKDKFSSYNWDMAVFGGMDTYKLSQKNVYYRDLGKEGHGRLGNQMFEISATISLALDNNATALFPRWEYNKYFKNEIKTTDTFDVSYEYHDNVFGYHPIPYQPNINLHGYFQSNKYFKHHEKVIRELFELKEEYENIIRNRWNHLLKTNTVSIHVRRGDYLNNPTFHISPPDHYYKKSLKYIKYIDNFNNIDNVLVFSDDIDWCKNYFTSDDYKYNFIEGQTDIEDLFLMSYCKHNIISNSSFSWWGSWLNKNPNKIVCFPSKWFGDEWNMNYEDIYYEGVKIIN